MAEYQCGRDCAPCGACRNPRAREISRRDFLLRLVGGCVALSGVGSALAACAPLAGDDSAETEADTPSESTPAVAVAPEMTVLPTAEGAWTLEATVNGSAPQGTGKIQIADVGKFSFDARDVETVRTDIFRPGHFSLFDILVHLGDRGDIDLAYHFDEAMDTHVIDAIDVHERWWYQAYYANGWFESNAFRMDMYPYKDDTTIRMSAAGAERQDEVYRTFRQEVDRLADNGGQVILPALAIRTPSVEYAFEDVVVTPHNVRGDVLQPGVVTALDALLSLGDEGKLPSVGVTWYERIGRADPVDSYWVEKVGPAEAHGGCGLVYETGPMAFRGFSGSHIHIPADVRATVSPEYALWFWICL